MNKLIQHTTKLYITDHADPSVGMFPCTWTVEVPFRVKPTRDKEELILFKQAIIELYKDFCDGKCTAYYDFESGDGI
jgi:hypothetical protein